MTFNISVPNASRSPYEFPAQNQTNMSRLTTTLRGDHQFNFSAAPNDGCHRQCTMIARANPVLTPTPAPLPAGTQAMLYTSMDSFGKPRLRYYDGTTITQITPFNLLAAVNFNGDGGVGNQVIRSSFNVLKVEKASDPRYKITFSQALPNNNYIVQVTGKISAGIYPGGICCGFVDGTLTYAAAVTTTTLSIAFGDNNGTSNNHIIPVEMGNVLVFGV